MRSLVGSVFVVCSMSCGTTPGDVLVSPAGRDAGGASIADDVADLGTAGDGEDSGAIDATTDPDPVPVEDPCSAAVIGCRIHETNTEYQYGSGCAPALSLVECTADASESDWSGAEHHWSVRRLHDDLPEPSLEERSEGSVMFQAEYEGQYRVELDIRDAAGPGSCRPAAFVLTVRGCLGDVP